MLKSYAINDNEFDKSTQSRHVRIRAGKPYYAGNGAVSIPTPQVDFSEYSTELGQSMAHAYDSVIKYQLERDSFNEPRLEKNLRDNVLSSMLLIKKKLNSPAILRLAKKDYYVDNTLNSILPDIASLVEKIDTIPAEEIPVQLSQIKQELHGAIGSHPEFNALMGNVWSEFSSLSKLKGEDGKPIDS